MWIYLPSQTWNCAPATEASESELRTLSKTFAQSATWKTKFLPPQSWLKILRKADWMTRLFGPISRRLTQVLFGEWILLAAGIHASHSVLPENVTEPKTRGICGHSSDQSLTLFDLPIASLKTSEGMFDWDCQKCLETSEDLATELGRVYSQRRKWARRTEESEFLSSQSGMDWSTPRSSPNENRTTKPAPSHGRTHGRCLAGDVQLWPTARAGDGKHGGPSQRDGSGSLSWGSPRVTTNGGAGKDRGDNRSRIEDQVHQWQTPSASAPDKEYTRDKGKKGSERLALSGQTLAWPTPTTRDHKDTGNLENVPTNSLLGRAVNDEKYWRTPGASDGEGG